MNLRKELRDAIVSITQKSMMMYPIETHYGVVDEILYQIECLLGVPPNYLAKEGPPETPYFASFHVRIGHRLIMVPRIFMAPNNREAMLKARNLQTLLFPGSPRVDDTGVYFFDGGEVAVALERLVAINPFDLSVDETVEFKSRAA